MDAGYNYGDTTEIFTTRYTVDKANLPSGEYRNVVGNHALSMGLAAAAERSKIGLFYGGYPITPASDILHTLSAWKHLGIKTFQAEDEIAGVTAAIGASFTGNLGVTATSGPGIALKCEAMGLAVIAELPLVVINVQRGGPSTGLPTKWGSTNTSIGVIYPWRLFLCSLRSMPNCCEIYDAGDASHGWLSG